MKYFVAFLAGAIVASSVFLVVVRSSSHSEIENLLSLSDADLVAHHEQIEEMEGVDGKILKALLACAAFRMNAKSAFENNNLAPPEKSKTTSGANSSSAGLINTNSAVSPNTSAPVQRSWSDSSNHTVNTSTTPIDTNRFFCSQVRDNPLALVADAKWSTIFPSPTASTRPVTKSYGWLTGVVSDTDLLNRKTCKTPDFLEFKDDERDELTFFKSLHGYVFEGIVHFNQASSQNLPLRRMHLHFNKNPADANQEYWFVYQNDGKTPADLFENRVSVDSGSLKGTVWRLNTCSQGVSILNDSCPWGASSDYDLEYKDFFYVTDSNELAGNIYCRHKSDQAWVKMGHFSLHTSTSPSEAVPD